MSPLKLRTLTQCIKCLASFCTISWDIREKCHSMSILAHCVQVLESCLATNSSDTDEDMATKIDFNAKALLRLACNMVTQSEPESDIQEACLSIMTNSESLMQHIGKCEDDDTISFPFLVFLYNAMAKKSQLRMKFVSAVDGYKFGVNALVKIFCYS